MKKLSIVVGLLACATTLSANTHQGFYTGLNVGYRNLILKDRSTAIGNGGAIANKGELAMGSLLAGISLSYLHEVSSNFYAGLEIAGDVTPQNKKIASGLSSADVSVYSLKVKSMFSYSGALVLGYACDKFLPYIKVGATGTQIKISGTRNADPANGIAQGSVQNASKNPFGILGGVGMQYGITDSFYLGSEYSYAYYIKKIKFADQYRNFNYTPSAHTFKVKFAYKF